MNMLANKHARTHARTPPRVYAFFSSLLPIVSAAAARTPYSRRRTHTTDRPADGSIF